MQSKAQMNHANSEKMEDLNAKNVEAETQELFYNYFYRHKASVISNINYISFSFSLINCRLIEYKNNFRVGLAFLKPWWGRSFT